MLRYDHEIEPVITQLVEAAASLPPLAVGDVQSRRDRVNGAYTAIDRRHAASAAASCFGARRGLTTGTPGGRGAGYGR